MAAALLELSDVLRSKTDEHKITPSESMLIGNCMAKSVKNFFVGALVSSAVVYRATRRLGSWYSFYLSAGSAMLIGKLMVDRSANACLEHILSIEGSRMQRELTNIILWKHRESPSKMQLVQKYFYPEIVFTDLKPDEPLLRWRGKNLYEDGTASRRTDDNGSRSKEEDVKTESSTQSKSKFEGDFLIDPLDCIIFGNQESSEDIHHANGEKIPRSKQRAHRRAHHHYRDRHKETYSHSTNDKLNSPQN